MIVTTDEILSHPDVEKFRFGRRWNDDGFFEITVGMGKESDQFEDREEALQAWLEKLLSCVGETRPFLWVVRPEMCNDSGYWKVYSRIVLLTHTANA